MISTFGTAAQLKSKHFQYLPVYRESLITSSSQDGGESVIGPSIASALSDGDTYAANVQVSKVTAIGFLCQKPIIKATDIHSTMNCTPASNNTAYDEGSVELSALLTGTSALSNLKIFPNPVADELNIIYNSQGALLSSKLNIYNCNGIIVKTLSLRDGLNIIDVTELSQGIYFISFINENKNYICKLVKC